MAYYIDPETGEPVFYDEQEDALTEQMIMDEPPLDARPFMPTAGRYESRPVGPPEGRRTTKGEIAQSLLDMEAARNRIPPKPTLLNDVSYETQPGVPVRGSVEPTLLTNIEQYRGKPKSLFIDENEGELIRYDESGQEVGERGITEKRKPPGPKPTLDKLDRMEFTNLHMKEKDPELQERAEKATAEWENSIPYTTRALKKDVFDMKRAEVRKAFYNEYRNEELQLVGSYITDRQREEAAKAKSLVIQALEEKLGRSATYQEKQTAVEGAAARSAGLKAIATEKGKTEGQKGMLSNDTLEQAYQYVKAKGEFAPEIARLFRVPGAQLEVMDYVSKRTKEEGAPGEERVVKGAIQKSVTSSLAFQEKQRGAMGSFVTNINKQINRVEEIEKDISRLGVRFLDVPVRELVARAKGSGKERALESYISEISSEISKLQQGSQASIQQLPVETQKKWDKIHDLYLPWSELKIVMENTRTQANDRITSVDDEIKFTQDKLRGYGGAVEKRKVESLSNKSQPSRAEREAEARRRGLIK